MSNLKLILLVALLALTAGGAADQKASFADLDKDGDNQVSPSELHNWFDDFRILAADHFHRMKDTAGKLSKVSFIESAAHWHPIHDAQVLALVVVVPNSNK